MAIEIQLRNGTSAEWTLANPILAEGEVGVETDTNYFKVGNGSSTWSSLDYARTLISQDANNRLVTDTQIATWNDKYTKAETESRIQDLINAAPAALDTLGEIATQLQNDESAVSALTTIVSNKADSSNVYTKTESNTLLLAKANLDVVTASTNGLMSSTDKVKFDTIAAGAEVNVNADWSSTSGDSQILNKPDGETLVPGFMNKYIIFPNIADPGAASSGTIRVYSKSVCGRSMLKWVGSSGLDNIAQPMIAFNKVAWWNPPGNSTTVPAVNGMSAYTTVGTATARNVATTNMFVRMKRLGFVSAATTGSLTSIRHPYAQFTIGNGSGLGGFTKVIRFGISDAATVSTARMFIGMSSSIAAPTNVEPSTLTNSIGVGHGASDSNLKLYYGGSTAQTPIDLGSNFPKNTLSVDVYELILFSSPNITNTVYYRVTRLNTGAVAEGTLTATTAGTQLPSATTLLNMTWCYRTNNTTALAVGLDIMSDYIETDY
jgi:hypothetical protein